MILALGIATFASIVCALGGALVAASRAGGQRRAALEAVAAAHSTEVARLTSAATRATTSQAALEQALALDVAGVASAHALVTDACLSSGASVATLADADGLPLAWSGAHDLAEDLAALAPDALEAMALGDELVVRGAHGGEVRGVCVRFDGARCVLFFGGDTRTASGSALALLRVRLDRLYGADMETELAHTRATKNDPLATTRRDIAAHRVTDDGGLAEIAAELALGWMSHGSSDTVSIGGAPPADWLADVMSLERLARRLPTELCRPHASLQLIRDGRSIARLTLGGLGAVTIGGTIADEPNTLPRIAASIARRMSRITSRAA